MLNTEWYAHRAEILNQQRFKQERFNVCVMHRWWCYFFPSFSNVNRFLYLMHLFCLASITWHRSSPLLSKHEFCIAFVVAFRSIKFGLVTRRRHYTPLHLQILMLSSANFHPPFFLKNFFRWKIQNFKPSNLCYAKMEEHHFWSNHFNRRSSTKNENLQINLSHNHIFFKIKIQLLTQNMLHFSISPTTTQ